ncbi:MAG: DUF1800 domain-containing protein [Chloroflexota bacterium]
MAMATVTTGQLTDRELMAHLYRRAGFGATPDELEAALTRGYEATVDLLLHPETQPDLDEDLIFRYYVDFHESRKIDSAMAHWVYRMINTHRPLEEKMTLFWHCLFATGNSKVEAPPTMLQQITTFRRFALGNFRDILVELSRDPAMIFWLDNQENTNAVHNENYGRELLELFSMGIGNYSEEDVKECARAFTGWTFKKPIPTAKPYGRFKWEFEFRPDLHDFGEKTFLGETGTFDGADVVDIIVRQPATAQFLARRLYLFFVSDKADQSAIDELADVYVRSGYEIRAMLRALFMSDYFRGRGAYYAMVKSPTDYVVGLLRLAKDFSFPRPGIYDAAFETRYMGQDLLNPPSVEGWHTGKEWIDTGILVERVNFAAGVVTDLDKPGIRQIVDRLRAAGELSSQELLDACLDALGPLPLRASTRLALIAHLDKEGPLRFGPGEDSAAEARVTELLQLIVAGREYQFM